MEQYHSNLSKWFRQSIFDLTFDISEDDLWKKFEYINSPGWTLCHLIVEGELAIKKLQPEYKMRIENFRDFMFGSDGTAKINLSKDELLEIFKPVYDSLEKEVSNKFQTLMLTDITDESLKSVLKTEMDFYLHIMTTHIAMHCDALMKWRLFNKMKNPYG
jgi:hypothetical protein